MRLLPLLLLGACLCAALPTAAQLSPDAKEEAREERLKILRAADQLDALQNTSEQTASKMAALQTSVAKLEKENTQLRHKLKQLEDRLAALQTAQEKQQKTILTEMRKLLKAQPAASAKPVAAPSPPPDSPPPGTWYEHVVEQGQTLSAIAQAFREQGVEVTVEDIRKANNIKQDNLIRVGQTLYIPKS